MHVRKPLSFLTLAALGCVLLLSVGDMAFAAITSPLTVYSANRHYLANSGQPVVILGAGCVLPGIKTENYRAYIDDMAAHNVNYGRVWHLLAWDARNTYWPWARDAGGAAVDGLAKYNLTHWDTNFWNRLKDACAYAQSKDIHLSIMLWDECGIETPTSSSNHRWDWHPFNPLNNVNGLSLPTSPDCVPEFYSLTNAKLKSLQELYVSKLISETSGYPNVNYEICNEYTGPWDWEKYWIDYITARCSNIVSVQRLGTFPSGYWTDSNIDMVKMHWNTTSPSETNSNMISYYSKNRVINYDETPEVSGISFTDYRRMLWASFVGGGHVHLENGINAGAALDAVLYAANFVRDNAVRFWEMSPNNSLVTSTPGGSAYTLAKPGSEYVIYISGSGSGSMTVGLTPGIIYTAKAYNPSNGAYADLVVNGNTVSSIPPYSSDIVVYIKASGQAQVSEPNVILILAADKPQPLPGQTVTYTLTYRNTADGDAHSVVVACPVPPYTTYVAGSASSGGAYDTVGKTVKWMMPTVSAGAGGTLTFKVKVD